MSGLHGPVSGLHGPVSGLHGPVSGLHGPILPWITVVHNSCNGMQGDSYVEQFPFCQKNEVKAKLYIADNSFRF